MFKKIVLLIISCFLISCNDKPISKSDFALNTYCEIKILKGGNIRLLANTFEYIKSLESLISKTDPNSDIYKINNNRKQFIQVSPTTFEIVNLATEIAEETETFDPLIGAITEQWDFKSGKNIVPKKQNIVKYLNESNYQNIRLDNENISIMIDSDVAKIDLGAIGKGYIADKTVEYLKNNGVESALLNFGGNVQTIGKKYNYKSKTYSDWKVSIQNPFEQGETIAIANIANQVVITSGDYQQFFIKDNLKYHHIIDTQSGFPAKSDLTSVTVISENGAISDAYATAFYVFGLDKIKEFIKNKPNISVLAVTKDNKIYANSSMLDIIEDSKSILKL